MGHVWGVGVTEILQISELLLDLDVKEEHTVYKYLLEEYNLATTTRTACATLRDARAGPEQHEAARRQLQRQLVFLDSARQDHANTIAEIDGGEKATVMNIDAQLASALADAQKLHTTLQEEELREAEERLRTAVLELEPICGGCIGGKVWTDTITATTWGEFMAQSEAFDGIDADSLDKKAASLLKLVDTHKTAMGNAGLTEPLQLHDQAHRAAYRAQLSKYEHELMQLFRQKNDALSMRSLVQPVVKSIRRIGGGTKEKEVLPPLLFARLLAALKTGA